MFLHLGVLVLALAEGGLVGSRWQRVPTGAVEPQGWLKMQMTLCLACTGCGDVLRAAGVADDKIRWVQKCGAVRTLQFDTTIVLFPVEDRTKTSLLGFVSKID